MQSEKGILPDAEFYRILDEILPGGSCKQTNNNSKWKIYFTRISIAGLEEMHGYSTDKRLYEYLEYKPFKTLNDTKVYLNKLIDLEGDNVFGRTAICWFVRRVKDKKLIGTVRLVEIDYNRQSVGWGYAIDPKLWGREYIFEIQEILKKYVFETLCLNRLWGCTRLDNKRTISALIATGMKEEGIFRQYLRDSDGCYHDAWWYSFLAQDYFTKKQQVENKNSKERITKKDIAKIIANELNGGSVEENSDMSSISNWDSLSHISVILAIEKEIGFSFTPKEIAQSTSVENIYNIVNNLK